MRVMEVSIIAEKNIYHFIRRNILINSLLFNALKNIQELFPKIIDMNKFIQSVRINIYDSCNFHHFYHSLY